MARGKSIPKQGSLVDRTAVRSNGKADRVPLAPTQAADEWISSILSATRQATQWMQDVDAKGAQFSSALPETFLKGMADFSRAANPWGLMSVFAEMSDRQMDQWAKPVMAAMQQMFDMQLLWIGYWDNMTSEPSEEGTSNPRNEDDVRKSWLHAQDRWLAMTKDFIDKSLVNLQSIQPHPSQA